MKQVCLLCERISPSGNLFCQEAYCPAEMSPTILNHGDWLGDIEIVKPVIILRAAVLYEAIHQQQKVYLKVAHPGAENKERLKREAELLRSIQGTLRFSKQLPQLLPPYANTSLRVDAYGKSMLRGHLLYFFLFTYSEGEPLRHLLLKNPQMWIHHVGWITASLATTVGYLQSKGLYHYGLSPDCVLVRFDEQHNAPRLLLFDLGIACKEQELARHWYDFFIPPAYKAPELSDGRTAQPDYRTDVYGLGLMLYELLVGQPAFPYKLQSADEIMRAIARQERVPMNRMEDVQSTANIALQAVSLRPEARPANAREMARTLLSQFGDLPEEKQRRWPSRRTSMIVAGTMIILTLLLLWALNPALGL
ncbi:MAG: protein kinase [Caldilineaceae bacterium]|nr:protein kinase [Caldilineaceae bacterium]